MATTGAHDHDHTHLTNPDNEREEMVEMSAALRHRNNKSSSSSDDDNKNGDDDPPLSVERVFEHKIVPSWQGQLTIRAFVVAFFLAVMFSVIVMKLNLTTGIIPSLNVSAGLLGFFFLRVWTGLLEKCNVTGKPFTRQENTVIQTAVVAAYGLAFSGGFGSYLFGMSSRVAEQATQAHDALDIKDPHLGWMIGFMFLVSFMGLFALVPLRKIMIIDYKLIYPSGTATSHLINGFHTPEGAKLAKEQVKTLGKFFAGSFVWGFFQWFYTGGSDCGFANFPTFGLQAYAERFYFDFSSTYVGVGMICPYIVNLSVLLGGVLSWGLMWPLVEKKKGDWYPDTLPSASLHGLQGYKVFISIAMILGDGLYNFGKVAFFMLKAGYKALFGKENNLPVTDSEGRDMRAQKPMSFDDQKRTQLFLKDQINTYCAIGGYVVVALISIMVLPQIFKPLKWYFILVAYLGAPILAFCNAYGCGLTDWSLASTYGKLAIFIIGSWASSGDGGVLAGLAACGVIMNIVSTAADLMQDFKTGYMTLTSPKSMFVSQVIGTGMGCVIAPCVFWLFYKAFDDIGLHNSEYPAPYAIVYRNMAILGVDGLSSLPKNCLTLCCIFFAVSFIINLIRDLVPPKVQKYIPLPMAMAIPFYLGSYFAIDMCVGSLVLFIWERIDKAKADQFASAVASGLICGDGLWSLPQSILSLARINPPICMKFLSRKMNEQVDGFISG